MSTKSGRSNLLVPRNLVMLTLRLSRRVSFPSSLSSLSQWDLRSCQGLCVLLALSGGHLVMCHSLSLLAFPKCNCWGILKIRWQSRNTKLTILKCYIQWNFAHSLLCSHHLSLVLKCFCHPSRPRTFLSSHSLFPPLSKLWQPLLCFLCLWICLFWTIQEMESHCYLWWASVSIFSSLIHIVALHSFLWLIILLCGWILCFYSGNGHLSCGCLLAVVNNAAMNICVQLFVSVLFGYISRTESLIMW